MNDPFIIDDNTGGEPADPNNIDWIDEVFGAWDRWQAGSMDIHRTTEYALRVRDNA